MLVCVCGVTSYSSLPDGVGVLEPRHNVVGDDEQEAEAVGAVVLEREGVALLVGDEWDGQDQVRPIWRQDCQVQHLHLWLRSLCAPQTISEPIR